MEKIKEIAAAKKRRAKLLKEFNRLRLKQPGWTQAKFALKQKPPISAARMWKLLQMAGKEEWERKWRFYLQQRGAR